MKSIVEQIKDMELKGLNDVISYAGSVAALAELLGMTRQSVYYWVERGSVSKSGAMKIEEVTSGRFKAEDLRPSVTQWRIK
ncbi:prophage repressor [Yersinia phage vB_YenS_P400]|nr:prophage repressor [Yersinia phage vB_YenS_P400]